MSSMDATHIHEPRRGASSYDFRALRDLLLVLCLTVLTVLALQAIDKTGAAGFGSATAVQDWKGNSGSLPAHL